MTTRTQELTAFGLPENTIAVALLPNLLAYENSMICRSDVNELSATVPVVVINRAEHVAINPINLAAAICVDSSERDVYLWEDEPSASLVNRARAAGIRGIVNCAQLELLLAAYEEVPTAIEVREVQTATECVESVAAAKSIDEWGLEELGLEEPSDRSAYYGNQSTGGYNPQKNVVVYKPTVNRQTASQPVDTGDMACDVTSAYEAHKQNQTALDKLVESVSKTAESCEVVTTDQTVFSSFAMPASQVEPGLQPQVIFNNQSTKSNIIGIFSGRGGVGKSTVSLLLAVLAYRQGLRVALVDADLQFGDIAYMLGHAARGQVDKVPLLAVEQSQASSYSEAPLLVLTAPENVEQSELIADDLANIVGRVAEHVDLVIVNTSAFWSTTQAELARVCTKLLFLMDQRTTSIKACKQVVELCIKLQIPEARFSYAINGCHRFAPVSPYDASTALGGAEVIGLEDGGNLVDELLSLGCPDELIDSENAFVRSLETLLSHLLPQFVDHSRQLNFADPEPFGLGFLKNLFKRGVRDAV